MKILLDTNMLLVPAQFGVDIFDQLLEHDLITLTSCVHELVMLTMGSGRDAGAAKVAMQLLEKKPIGIMPTKEKGDTSIIHYAVREKCAVATNDKALIKALKEKGIKIFRLKQKKYIVEE